MAKKYDSQLVFNLDESTVRWLTDYAEEHGGTLGGAVRLALEDGLEEARDAEKVDHRKLIHAHVTAETRQAVVDIAERADCSIARVCRHLVEAGVEKRKGSK